MKLVIVESPAKAQTINKYLGNNYKVVASIGHVRDLPRKDGAVEPDNDFNMSWDQPVDKKNVISGIIKELKKAESLILATDPDREGEAISWHINEILNEKNVLSSKQVQRVVFNEVTKSSVLSAMENPREINSELVEAYLARRALDHLIGFRISPILWRKLPGSRSAGRVQSVALRLVCERELEIEKFNIEEYWTISAIFQNSNSDNLYSRLIEFDQKKLKKFDIKNKQEATEIINEIKQNSFSISNIEKKRVKRNPIPPFTTSTLQQEASRKLGFSAYKTMRVAQKLYEGISLNQETSGLITYMRTDGVQISQEAISNVREFISRTYGKDYIPEKPNFYKSKAANAQEAHEAIRPTNFDYSPKSISKYLDQDQLKLYDLIWKRTVSSQMSSAQLDKTSVDIKSENKLITFRINGSQIVFPGFLKVYKESFDEKTTSAENDEDKLLPDLQLKENLKIIKLEDEQHFTLPPPRFTDASLVKKMEELGIGRPSTYASTLRVLIERDYVTKENGKLIPEERGRILTAFLSNFFGKYVDYEFTAKLEKDLDKISDGKLPYKELLSDFWLDFKKHLDKMTDLERSEILETLENELEQMFFSNDDKEFNVSRKCPKCSEGKIGLQLGKYGAFIGCNNYPECKYTKQIAKKDDENPGFDEETNFDTSLGNHPETKEDIFIKKGPYGSYVQLGETKKPKRVSIPKLVNPKDINLEKAILLLSLPRIIGNHPETSKEISANIGRYGPYLKYDVNSVSLPNDETVLTIGLNHAVVLISEKSPGGKSLGKHPNNDGDVLAKKGRYGPYVEYKKVRATLPKTMNLDEITLEEAIELIEKKELRSKKKNN